MPRLLKMSDTEVVTPTADKPIDVHECLTRLRIDSAEEDLVTDLLTAAIARAEGYCGIAIGRQTWRVNLAEFDQHVMELPGAELRASPVTAINKIEYRQSIGGAFVSLPGDQFELSAGRYIRVESRLWITPSDWRVPGDVAIEYDIGKADLPADLVTAITMLVGQLYATRDDFLPGMKQQAQPPYAGAKVLLDRYKTVWVA